MARYDTSYLERLAREWQSAYAGANQKEAPDVEWQRGWFKIGHHRYRRKELEAARDRLRRVSKIIETTG